MGSFAWWGWGVEEGAVQGKADRGVGLVLARLTHATVCVGA